MRLVEKIKDKNYFKEKSDSALRNDKIRENRLKGCEHVQRINKFYSDACVEIDILPYLNFRI